MSDRDDGNLCQLDLTDFTNLSTLTEAEREAYRSVRLGELGPREYQRLQGYSSPGTVSNLLARAESKLDDRGAK